MTSLKRPLDLSEHLDSHWSERSWNENEFSLDEIPSLQDCSWADYTEELLGSNDFEMPSEGFLEESCISGPISFAQEQIEQWAAENFPSQETSSAPSCQEKADPICYGMIYNVAAKLRGEMSELDRKLHTYPFNGQCELHITKADDRFLITFPDGAVMGEANSQLEKALENLSHTPIDFEVLAPVKPVRETISRAFKEKDAIVRVNVNVYGSAVHAGQIGRELSQCKLYLQKPDHMRKGYTYDNPHILKFPNFQSSSNDSIVQFEVGVGKKSEGNKVEIFKRTISEVYSSLTRGRKLVGLEGDERLKTPLLMHQKQALDFMSQRESGPIPEEFCLWKAYETEGQPCFRHAVTNQTARIPQTETGGGILADEMGMGKTLSILALILRTLKSAHKWALGIEDTLNATREILTKSKPEYRSRATLILASSDLMINEWLLEIERHFHHQISGSLKTIKYHGQYRETDVDRLRDADLVITTYHTLASDFASRKNPLNGIAWYRLVLDEAHIIRRQSTGLNRTVSHLTARFRWCLTGTPVQNRLEDIGSLFAFIRVNPFHNLSVFRKFIALPFDEGGKRREIAIERFTRLLDSMCLRRTKDLLHLPDQHDRVRSINFSVEEREQYEQTKKMMGRAIRNQAREFEHKSTLGMFQLQLQLRILCNHGTFQQPFSWHRRKRHLLDEREDMKNSLGGEGEVTCSNCRQTMPAFGTGSLFRHYADICKHVLCLECIEESMPSTQHELPTDCPLCSSLWGSMGNTNSHSQSQMLALSIDNDTYFRPEGQSSKIMALMQDVIIDLWKTKSIIFSCWTRTLDLIQMYLTRSSIDFQRIDGECSTARRERILDDFEKNPELRVLIMTTGTGAVGLNLAIANRVFIVEPQWNPSVENQAIARALRLGQEQSVQVTRYVVNGTVEQEMRSLQARKLELAGIAWE